MLAIDEDEIEVELPQNVDHPWGCEREVVAVRFASGTHGGFDSVGLLHPMSSYVRRLRSDRPNPVGVWPVGSGRTPYQEKPVSKMSCKAPSGNGLYAPKALIRETGSQAQSGPARISPAIAPPLRSS